MLLILSLGHGFNDKKVLFVQLKNCEFLHSFIFIVFTMIYIILCSHVICCKVCFELPVMAFSFICLICIFIGICRLGIRL